MGKSIGSEVIELVTSGRLTTGDVLLNRVVDDCTMDGNPKLSISRLGRGMDEAECPG